jgi:uncharacterized protein (DUF924 family)
MRLLRLPLHAMAGELQGWQSQAEGWLGHILLHDQLPRMIFRGTPPAFAGARWRCPCCSKVLPKVGICC